METKENLFNCLVKQIYRKLNKKIENNSVHLHACHESMTLIEKNAMTLSASEA
jgi:hypothetical protein